MMIMTMTMAISRDRDGGVQARERETVIGGIVVAQEPLRPMNLCLLALHRRMVEWEHSFLLLQMLCLV